MFILKQLNRKLFNYLSLVLLVATLLVFPPAFPTQIPFSNSPAIISSVNAQTTQPESNEPESGASQEPKLPLSQEEGEESIDFFKMIMGAIAGLVLFIYGVTRLAEGLEDVGEERMKRLLSKFTTNRFAGVQPELLLQHS